MDPEQEAKLAMFNTEVLRWASPADLAGYYAPGLSPSLVERLSSSPRLGRRHATFISEQLGAVDFSGLEPGEQALVLAGSDMLDAAANLAGAVWHGHRVRGLVLSADVNAFLADFGAIARQAAVRHVLPDRLNSSDTQPLALVVKQDGLACRAAWIDQLPRAIRCRVSLRLSGTTSFEQTHREWGPKILRLVAAAAVSA